MKTINTYINEKLRLSAKRQYTCQPQSKNELRQIIIDRIEEEGYNCDLNDIDVSKITDMSDLCNGGIGKFKDFNGDISLWDVSNVTNIGFMFFNCQKFNQDLNKWDVSHVTNMYMAFYNCPTQPTWYDESKAR